MNVLDELEALKPEFQRRVEELNRGNTGLQLVGLDSEDRTRYTSGTASVNWPSNVGSSFSATDNQVLARRNQCYLNIYHMLESEKCNRNAR